MSIKLKLFILLLLLIQFILIIITVKKKKLTMKYASFWIFLLLIMTIVNFYPDIAFKLSALVDFEKTSNMIFLLGFFFIFYIIFTLTMSISIQNNKIKSLIQEISILKKRVEEYDRKE